MMMAGARTLAGAKWHKWQCSSVCSSAVSRTSHRSLGIGLLSFTDHHRSFPTSRISYQDFCVVLACANDWSLLLARNACAHASFQGPGPGPEQCLCTSTSPGAERDAFSNFRPFEQLRSTGFHYVFVHLKCSLAASVCDLKILSLDQSRAGKAVHVGVELEWLMDAMSQHSGPDIIIAVQDWPNSRASRPDSWKFSSTAFTIRRIRVALAKP